MNSPILAMDDWEKFKLQQFLRECERLYLERVLTAAEGNRTRAAEIAGLTLPTLRAKLANYTVKASYTLN